jgi:hypothetical protein
MKRPSIAFLLAIATFLTTACESFFLDEDYSQTAIPVLTLEEFQARGYGNPLELDYLHRLGTVSFATDLYPNHPEKRRELIIYYMAQDARRDYPGATIMVMTHYQTVGGMSSGYGLAVNQPINP